MAGSVIPIELGGSRPLAGQRLLARHAGWIATIACACFAINVLFSRYLFWDTYVDLAGGRYITQHGIPRHEAFTIVAHGRRWIDQQWLAHLVYYETWHLGGYPLLAAFSSLLVASAFGLLAALLVSRGVPPQRALLWTLGAYIACLGNTIIRAQSFAYLLFVALLWLMLADARRPSLRFLIALPLLALWSNLHGTALLGIGLVVGYATIRFALAARAGNGRLASTYAASAVGAAGALFATPYGPGIVDYYGALIGNPVLRRNIQEWAPPSLDRAASIPFFALLICVIVAVAYSVGRGYRPSATGLGIAVALTLLATQAARYQAWAAIAGAALAAEALAAVRPAPTEFPRRLQRLAATVVVAYAAVMTGVLAGTGDATFESLLPRSAMAAAVSYSTAHPNARILADESASALLWDYPDTAGRIAYDARLEQYPQRKLERWFQFLGTSTPEWADLTRGYNVLLVSRVYHPGLVRGLARLHGWRLLFTDADGVVFVRGDG